MDIILSTYPEDKKIDPAVVEDVKNAAQKVAEIYDVKEQEVSITLTGNAYIRTLNKEWRNIDRATDVLSFAFAESNEPQVSGGAPTSLGEIVISVERAAEQADAYGHTLRREVSFLTVHGMLHLLGYDHIHDIDRRDMEREQRFVMDKLGINRGQDDGE